MKFDRPVVLASGSPRRLDLLKELISEFEVVVSNVDEDAITVADPYRTAEGLARAKAEAVLRLRPNAMVIGGDTVVALPTGEDLFRQFSKPVSVADAEAMLAILAGRTHFVITGVAVISSLRSVSFSETSRVTFRNLDAEQIRAYVATGEPMDKAGGYACQGGAKPFIERLEGSISNVVGLPLERLRLELENFATQT